MEATGMMMIKTTFLVIGQIALVIGQIAMYKAIQDLRHREHWHTYWFKDGKKVNETISSYEAMETHYE